MYRHKYYDNWLDRFMNDDGWRIKVVFSTAAIILVLTGVWYMFVYRKTVNAQVIDTAWELKVDQLQYTTLQESGWSVPEGGRVDHSNWEYHYSYRYQSGTKTVTSTGTQSYSCGTTKKPRTCTRSVTTTKTVPVYSTRDVYDWKYYYYIDRWINIAPLITSGKNKEDVHWPDTTDHSYNEANIVGNIKLGTKHSHYQLTVAANNDQTYSIDMVESMWRTYGVGTKATLTLGFFNNVIGIEQKGW